MRMFLKLYSFIQLFLIISSIWMQGAGMGMMGGWMKMMYDKKHHKLHDLYENDKQINLNFKPIAIPLPLPLPIPTFVKEKPVKYKKIPVPVEHMFEPVPHPVPVHVPVPVPVMKHIPIMKPVPVPIKVKEIRTIEKVKGDVKPWKSEAKDMFWNMMMLKVVTDGKSKGKKGACCSNGNNGQKHIEISMKKAKGGDKKVASSSMCFPTMMQAAWPMQSGWTMPMQSGWAMPEESGWDMAMKAMMMKAHMKASMMKAAKMKAEKMKAAIADKMKAKMKMKAMMKAKMKSKDCAVTDMNGGWPMTVTMDYPAGWWPDEDEEDEEDEEDWEEEPMTGWDTEEVPFTRLPKDQYTGRERRGDTQRRRTGQFNRRNRLSSRRRRPRSVFRKGANLFDYDFDFDFDFDYY